MKTEYKVIIGMLIALLITIGAGIFLYTQMDKYKNELDLTKTQLEDTGKEYNQAKIGMQEDKIKIEAIDQKLNESLKKTKAIERMIILWSNDSKGGGKTTDKEVYIPSAGLVTEVPEGLTYYTKYNFKDFRIDITTDTKDDTILYKLSQKMGLKIYKLGDFDYRAEIIEYNKDTSEPVATFPVDKFDIRKVYTNPNKVHFGFNLVVGGNVGMNSKFEFKKGGSLGVNFMSYGQTHLQSKFRFLTVHAGTDGAFIAPFSYNIHDLIKIFNDLYIDVPMIGIEYNKGITPIVGIGISSTL